MVKKGAQGLLHALQGLLRTDTFVPRRRHEGASPGAYDQRELLQGIVGRLHGASAGEGSGEARSYSP
jgi:hypothetical protein